MIGSLRESEDPKKGVGDTTQDASLEPMPLKCSTWGSLRAHSVALVSKPVPAKSTHVQNPVISKLEGLTIPVSKLGRLFGCPLVSKQV
jgi:hypothetical protein